MAILVTGGAGYIGSVTVDVLRANGEAVVVLDDLARGHRAAVNESAALYVGRIGDRDLVDRIVKEHGVEECVHFAALAYVGESVAEPRRYFERNIGEGLGLIGSLLDAGVRRIVFSSTCATYGEPDEVPIPETQAQSPANPYGWSKLVIEAALRSYASPYGLRSVSLRYFNAAGATERRRRAPRARDPPDPDSHRDGARQAPSRLDLRGRLLRRRTAPRFATTSMSKISLGPIWPPCAISAGALNRRRSTSAPVADTPCSRCSIRLGASPAAPSTPAGKGAGRAIRPDSSRTLRGPGTCSAGSQGPPTST